MRRAYFYPLCLCVFFGRLWHVEGGSFWAWPADSLGHKSLIIFHNSTLKERTKDKGILLVSSQSLRQLFSLFLSSLASFQKCMQMTSPGREGIYHMGGHWQEGKTKRTGIAQKVTLANGHKSPPKNVRDSRRRGSEKICEYLPLPSYQILLL